VATNKDKEQAPQPAQAGVAPLPQALVVPEQPADEVPWEGGGGRFIVNGRLVDHEGRPLNEDGSLKKEET